MDLFKWSVPFLMEKIGDMMEHLMKKSRANELETDKKGVQGSESLDGTEVQAILESQQNEQNEEAKKAAAKKHRMTVLKQKIRFVGRMSRMLKTIRTNADEIRQIKENRPDHKLPFGTLVGGSQQVHDLMAGFHKTRIADSHNDKMPHMSRRVSQKTRALQKQNTDQAD